MTGYSKGLDKTEILKITIHMHFSLTTFMCVMLPNNLRGDSEFKNVLYVKAFQSHI